MGQDHLKSSAGVFSMLSRGMAVLLKEVLMGMTLVFLLFEESPCKGLQIMGLDFDFNFPLTDFDLGVFALDLGLDVGDGA